MKAYGIPRLRWLQCPDVGDITYYAFKSSCGKFKTKSGEYKGYIRSSTKKRATRRIWKKKQRAIDKTNLRNQMSELPILGYNINTGQPIYHPSHRLQHVGNGYYERSCDITPEDKARRLKFFASIDREIIFNKLGMEEA